MPLFKNTRLEGDELDLEADLLFCFKDSKDKIRWDRNIKDDCVLHSIKNKRTRNTAVIKDYRRTGGGIQVVIFTRKKHIAANIADDAKVVVNEMYTTFLNKEIGAKIGVYLSTESEFSVEPLVRIKMTKKQISDLAEDECTGGYVVDTNYLKSNGVQFIELIFENNSGRFIQDAEKISKLTNNPVSNFVVFNNKGHVAFYPPARFLQLFRPEESTTQVSQPADLFALATQPAPLI